MASPGEWAGAVGHAGVGAAKYRAIGRGLWLAYSQRSTVSQAFLRIASAFLSILPSSAFDIRPALAA